MTKSSSQETLERPRSSYQEALEKPKVNSEKQKQNCLACPGSRVLAIFGPKRTQKVNPPCRKVKNWQMSVVWVVED